MRYDTRRRYGSTFRSSLPSGVKWLLIANFAVFAANFIAGRVGFGGLFVPLMLWPNQVVHSLAIWQLVTYLFLHSTTDPLHILFNMLALWMFGAEIERTWGTRKFLKYYFICGIGAGVCVVLISVLVGAGASPTIGASGAIYGLLLAFGLLFPDAIVFFLVFPMKAKYLVIIMGALAFFFSIRGGNGNVSNVAHLGGLLVGFLYMRFGIRGFRPTVSLHQRYDQWKLDRAKRKFQVYLKKHGSNKEPWVH